jgi:hypothetical protein
MRRFKRGASKPNCTGYQTPAPYTHRVFPQQHQVLGVEAVFFALKTHI